MVCFTQQEAERLHSERKCRLFYRKLSFTRLIGNGVIWSRAAGSFAAALTHNSQVRPSVQQPPELQSMTVRADSSIA
jgi:hypothetical protein